MKILLAIPQWESFAQLMTVLIIFLIVLAMTYLTTRWIANYQKEYNINHNIEVIETFKLTTNKYIQIVKAGDKYLVIGICKDSITMLSNTYDRIIIKKAYILEKSYMLSILYRCYFHFFSYPSVW